MRHFFLIMFAGALICSYSCKTDKVDEKKEKKELATFNFSPPKPINGKLKGVVELGASGFNSFIVEIDEDKNWETKKVEYGSSLIIEAMTNTSEVNLKLKEYVQKITGYGLTMKDIYFVVSSGAFKEDLTKTIVKELKNIGHNVEVVTPLQEAQYALKAVLPKQYYSSGFVVDIGSGNTKISYADNSAIVGFETFGAKYYQNAIDDAVVYKEVKEIASKVPFEKRKYCFLIGGVPYQMASLTKKEGERYTVLSPDANDFLEAVEKKGKKVKSGLTIYKAILDATDSEVVVFDDNNNFVIGYLLSLSDKQ